MTRRKDPQPETLQPETLQTDAVQTGPFVAEVDPSPVEPAPIEPAPAPELPPPPPAPRRPGVLAPLLGGALAAIGGFALSQFNAFGLASAPTVDLGPLTQQIQDVTARESAALDKIASDLSALADRVAVLESSPVPDLSRLDAIEQRLSAIETLPAGGSASSPAVAAKLAELEQRIAALPSGGSDPALQQKLDDALARLAEAETAASTRATEAEAAAARSVRATALDSLSDAVLAGQSFTTELQALADPALTQALGGMAESGVPTLASLQASFPEAAREALRTARALGTEDGWGDRVVDFLAAQTGARPLTPLEGNTPDAILSRAEFALTEGRVADALTELDPLDAAVKAPLDAWITQAKAQLAAAAALQAARGQ